jgi:tetratricopeptide (TPR) repeat protein
VQAAQRLAMAAADLLELGNEDQAAAEIQRALVADPNNRLAQSLLKQIQTDPQTLLGREYFTYRVEPGESLSRIAGRFLKRRAPVLHALARYNDIKVPRQLQGGQTIRMCRARHRRRPRPHHRPQNRLPGARLRQRPQPRHHPTMTLVPPKARSADQRSMRATRAARVAFARQDLTNAIRNWDIVLELDPSNTNGAVGAQEGRRPAR